MFREGEHGAFVASSALGQIGTAQAIDTLMEGLTAKHEMERHTALMGLMSVEKLERLGPIVRCLRDKWAHNRMLAMTILERNDPPQLIEWIAPMLEDEDQLVRLVSAAALRRKGDTRAEAIIKEALNSKDERARKWAESFREHQVSAP